MTEDQRIEKNKRREMRRKMNIIRAERLISKHIRNVVTAERISHLGRKGSLIICTMAEEVIRKLPKNKTYPRQRTLSGMADCIISYIYNDEVLQKALDQAYTRRNEH